MHPLIEFAKQSVETYIKEGKIMPLPENLSPKLAQKAGVFVCLKKHGQLRGCIGTFLPATSCIGMETILNAISAATRDPRFPPVQLDELESLEYTVDILSCPEKVEEISQLNPKKYGVIIVSRDKRGLLLPDLEGVDTIEEQLRIARMKAGISPHEKADVYRFHVIRYK
ncbi:MAG: AmmeMemoRadiSam system protein A [Nitrospirota bacterium]